jgi:hypothetical protein
MTRPPLGPGDSRGAASGSIGVLTRQHVRHFDDVADSPDVRIGCAHLRIDSNDTGQRTDLAPAARWPALGPAGRANGVQ